jgi:hypothetical protein
MRFVRCDVRDHIVSPKNDITDHRIGATVRCSCRTVSNSAFAADTPTGGVRMAGRRLIVAQALRLQEGQQVGVDCFRLRGRHAMREALIGLQRAVL